MSQRLDKLEKLGAEAEPAPARQTGPSRAALDAAAEREGENEKREAQSRADRAANAFGETAPPPMSGEMPIDYRHRLLRRFQRHSPDFKDADIRAIMDTRLLNGVETRIYADAMQASKIPDTHGELRPFTRIDPETGVRITEFRGHGTYIQNIKPPSMRVTAFNLPSRQG